MFECSRCSGSSISRVFSHFLKKTEWQNSRIMKGDLARIVARLKREPGKDIIVDGGPSVVQELMQRSLADDYRMMVWPAILGGGKNYWGSSRNRQPRKLL